MKKQTTIITIVLLLFAITANSQTRWRVNNTPGVSADFASVQAAVDSANAGDIIYIENSGIPYDNVIIEKQLTLLGPGYFLASNDSTQANKSNTMLPNVTFNPQSSGSVMMGVWVTNILYVNASNVVISRNRINEMRLAYSNEAGNILVAQNYVNGISNWSREYYFTAVIINNIIVGKVDINSYGSVEFRNNVVEYSNTSSAYYWAVILNNSTIKNNIVIRLPDNGYYYNYGIACDGTLNNAIEYNLCNQDSVANYPNNIWEMNIEEVVVNAGGPESKYYLKEGSPAIGYGEFGGDCGAFGGDSPYVLSGLPPVPHIFQTSIPISGTSNSGLPVNVKIKSQN